MQTAIVLPSKNAFDVHARVSDPRHRPSPVRPETTPCPATAAGETDGRLTFRIMDISAAATGGVHALC